MNFDFSKLDFNDWPFQSEFTDFSKYYPDPNNCEILNYYNKNFKGKYPNFLDLLIWSIFTTGFNLTLAIQSFRKYSFISLLINLFLSIFDLYSLVMNIININWGDAWNPGIIGFILFVTETFFSFTFFSILCNISTRSLTLAFYLINFKEIFGKNTFLAIFQFFFAIYTFCLGLASFFILIGIFLLYFFVFPYFLAGFLFVIIPLYILTIIQNLSTSFLIIPLQFFIGIMLSLKDTFKNIFQKEAKEDTLVETSSEFYEDWNYEERNQDMQKDFLFAFIETFIFIRFYYLLNILTIQFTILLLNGYNFFSILKLFFGLPYLSSSYYSFSLRVYIDKFINLIAKLSTLL